jgi:hypothetical protein
VDYVFGLARSDRLEKAIIPELITAMIDSIRTGRTARCFKDFRYTRLDSWSRERRVIRQAEVTGGEANPRFVVTSLKRSEAGARQLHEKIYCARGDMENRIKECQLDLFADRTSTATMQANQLRLWFASMAYVLLCGLRRIGLAHAVRRGNLRHDPAEAVEAGRLEFGSACGGSRSPWRQPARGRTRSNWPMPDDATPSPDTNQTAHRCHAARPTPPRSRRGRSSAGIRTFPAVTPDGAGTRSGSGT